MAWSLTKFSGEEIVRLAVDIEKQGQKFYEIAATKIDDPEVKEMFEFLAQEESQHINDFKALGDSLSGDFTPNESYVGEYSDYIKALIDNHVFNHNNIEKFLENLSSASEALAIAFRFEKDSILIFQELCNVVNEEGKKIVDELVEQEKQHIRKLSSKASSL